ncbi:MAG: class I SAM-dependent methyltransferase [Lachnospiraceae bacterium]|nr:class I SAM-dependent methyltransferase [Candidatus Merdinaster equi]
MPSKLPTCPNGLKLEYTQEGLTLTDGTLSLTADLTESLPRLKQSNLERELLVKAARIKGLERVPRLIDATAGFGEDSLLLAASGYQVTLFEYDPIIAVLLEDALDRASKNEMLSGIVSRMKLIQGDSIEAMKSNSLEADVILLDPMFPERQKSGLIKKKFQLLQKLESPCSDEKELLEAALLVKPRKIVIKRPLKGPYLAGRKPDYSVSGKAIRYDCIYLV